MKDLSALFRPLARDWKNVANDMKVLTDWEIDGDPTHPFFDTTSGVFKVPTGGLYCVVVELIPTDGGANVEGALHRRKTVAYVLRVEDPQVGDTPHSTNFLDVGPSSFGEMMRLREGAILSVCMMPEIQCRESVRIKIDLVQRKRQRENDEDEEVTEKERKKRTKKRRKERAKSKLGTSAVKHEPGKVELKRESTELMVKPEPKDENSSCSSDWSSQFSSDNSEDELPHSKKAVSRLAKDIKNRV